MNITKQQFTTAMDALHKQSLINIRINAGLEMIFKDACFVVPVDNASNKGLIDLLVSLTDDYAEGWIEYFIYELDWGKKDGDVRINNKRVPFSTTDDLWDVLNS